MSKEIVKISPQELSLVDNNSLNAKQLQLLLKRTPQQYVKSRPAKGGGQWSYVSGGYVRKVLNLMFGWEWSFEILDEKIMGGEAIVKGKLTCVSNGKTIVKMQYGNKDIAYKKAAAGEERQPLSLGNDLKAAATDALKKCAAELGIANDVYNKEEFKEITVDTESIENVNNSKEKERIKQHIEASQTIDEIEMVEHLIELHDLEKEYFKKLKTLK